MDMKTHIEYDDFGEYMEMLEDIDVTEEHRFQVKETFEIVSPLWYPYAV